MRVRTAHILRSAVTAAVLLAAVAAPAQAQQVAYTGSLQYATGDYIFTERTRSVYFFSGLSVSTGRLTASVSLPVIVQNSPWVSYGGAGVVPSGGPQQGHVKGRGGGGRGAGHDIALVDTFSYSDVGLGDPMGHAAVTLLEARGARPGFRLAAALKPPVADVDRGFGTGAWDAGGGVSLSQVLGRWFVFADAMYWRLGEMEQLELNDPVAFGIALGKPLMNGTLGVLGSLSGYTEIVEGVDPPLQAGLGLTYTLSSGHGLSAGVAFGLSESTPDVSVSFGWRVGF